jgi:hypothetical protein
MLPADQAGPLSSAGESFLKKAMTFFRNTNRRMITTSATHPITIPAIAPLDSPLPELLDPLLLFEVELAVEPVLVLVAV